MDGISGRPGTGSSGTQPPTSPTGYNGPYLAGTVFEVTAGGLWFEGYYFWCPPGGDTGPQKFALWGLTGASAGAVISGSVVTSGTLTAGAFNFVPVASPFQLAIGTEYLPATGYTASAGFPLTANQFGSGDPYSGGIVNGPLTAYSDGDGGGSAPATAFTPQGVFSTAGSDPSVDMPASGFDSGNFWVDVQVSDTAPSGYTGSYRIWPNKLDVAATGTGIDSADNYILGTEFSLSGSCALNNIWFYSPSGASQLPTQCAIWDVSTQTMVSGTLKTSPSWSGAAGSGWVSASYSGVTLPAGDYKTSVWNGAGTPSGWNEYTLDYFTTGAGGSGITTGPISVPDASSATSPGQSTYQTSSTTFLYPDQYVATEGQAYWVDVEVTPQTAAAGAATISGQGQLSQPDSTDAAGETVGGHGSLGQPDSADAAGSTLTGQGNVGQPDSADSAAGTMAGQGSVGQPDSTLSVIATLAGQGSLADAATDSAPDTIQGAGTLAPAATIEAPATLSGASSLSDTDGTGSDGGIAGASSLGQPASADDATGSLAGQGSVGPLDTTDQAPATLTGQSSLSDTATIEAPDTITGQGQVNASTSPQGDSGLTGSSTFGAPDSTLGVGETITGAGQLATASDVEPPATMAGQAQLGTSSADEPPATMAGQGQLTGTGGVPSGQGATMTGGGQFGQPDTTEDAGEVLGGHGSITAAATVVTPGGLPPLPDGITVGAPYSRWSAGEPYGRYSAAAPHG
jgi:hypothetical protein